MKTASVVAIIVVFGACSARHVPDPLPAGEQVGFDCGDQTCREAARDHALGRGVPRDYAAEVRLLEQGCKGGDPIACRELGLALLFGRGVARDKARGLTALDDACARGDVVTCVVLGFSGHHPAEPALMDRLEAACDADDLDACVLEMRVAGSGDLDCGSNCQERWARDGAALCKRGAIDGCSIAVAQLLSWCHDAAECDAMAAEAEPDTRAAYLQVVAACAEGDAAICAELPGRAIPLAELCAASDYGACYAAARLDGASLDPARVACERGALGEACVLLAEDLRYGEHARVGETLAMYQRACDLGDPHACSAVDGQDLASGCPRSVRVIPAADAVPPEYLAVDVERVTLLIYEEVASAARLDAARAGGVEILLLDEDQEDLVRADAMLVDATGNVRAEMYADPDEGLPASFGRCIAALAAAL